jgi:hypothetical protein
VGGGRGGVGLLMRWTVPLLVLAACAAPAGTKAVNPACVWHCVVEIMDAGNNPKLATLTATQGSTATGGTRTKTITETGP